MTLVIAVKWLMRDKEAVLMVSDTRARVGGLTPYEARKILPIIIIRDEEEVPLAIVGGAGEATFIKYAFRVCEDVLKSRAGEWNYRTPTALQFEKAVRAIEGILTDRYFYLESKGIESNYQLILASVDEYGKASIYTVDSRGLVTPVHDNPGFAMIGSGFITGGALLMRLLGYSPETSNEMDLGVLTAFIIDVVSLVDQNVGPFTGESYLMRYDVEERKVTLGPLKPEAIIEYRERVKQRRNLIRHLWRLCDLIGEENLEEILQEFEKELSQGELHAKLENS